MCQALGKRRTRFESKAAVYIHMSVLIEQYGLPEFIFAEFSFSLGKKGPMLCPAEVAHSWLWKGILSFLGSPPRGGWSTGWNESKKRSSDKAENKTLQWKISNGGLSPRNQEWIQELMDRAVTRNPACLRSQNGGMLWHAWLQVPDDVVHRHWDPKEQASFLRKQLNTSYILFVFVWRFLCKFLVS